MKDVRSYTHDFAKVWEIDVLLFVFFFSFSMCMTRDSYEYYRALTWYSDEEAGNPFIYMGILHSFLGFPNTTRESQVHA